LVEVKLLAGRSMATMEDEDLDATCDIGDEAEIDPSLRASARTRLAMFFVGLIVVVGTVVFGVGPPVVGSLLLGQQVGVPLGTSVAAACMITALWASMRHPDVPASWASGLLSFVIGIVMLLLAPIVTAQAVIRSQPEAGAVGALVGAALVTGLLVFGKRRGLWSRAMGWPGVPPQTGAGPFS
jgi:hypothetical protein